MTLRDNGKVAKQASCRIFKKLDMSASFPHYCCIKFNPTEQLTEKRLRSIFHEISTSGTIVFSKHAKERMLERGYNTQDIFYILTKGSLVNTTFNEKAKNWKYTFRGDDLDGDQGSVVVAVAMHLKCIVITVLT